MSVMEFPFAFVWKRFASALPVSVCVCNMCIVWLFACSGERVQCDGLKVVVRGRSRRLAMRRRRRRWKQARAFRNVNVCDALLKNKGKFQ